MQVVSSRTAKAPVRPFTHGERTALVSGCFVLYSMVAACVADATPATVASALGTKVSFGPCGWTQAWFPFAVLGFFPFTALFLRAAHRLLRPLLRLERLPTEIEESPDELARWASSTLDKKRKP